MRAEDKERLARRQRMLARERGEPLPQPRAPPAPPGSRRATLDAVRRLSSSSGDGLLGRL